MRTIMVNTHFTTRGLKEDLEWVRQMYGGRFGLQVRYPGTWNLGGLAYIGVVEEPLLDDEYDGVLKDLVNPECVRWLVPRPSEAWNWRRADWENYYRSPSLFWDEKTPPEWVGLHEPDLPYPEEAVSLRDNLLMEARSPGTSAERLAELALDERWALKQAVAGNPVTPAKALQVLLEVARSWREDRVNDQRAQVIWRLVENPSTSSETLKEIGEIGWLLGPQNAALARLVSV